VAIIKELILLRQVLGSDLFSIVDGIIIDKGYSASGYGNYIVMKDLGNNQAFLYGHLREASPLSIGDLVTFGTYVGHEGTTGNSTGIHLHLEQQDLSNREWYFGNDISYYINPCDFMGIPNVTGTECIYNGTPIIPPTIKEFKTKFKWVVFTNKIRKRRK
jgi:murein DD-endopeptidase MepM/ murein hydrolase activator NlpD